MASVCPLVTALFKIKPWPLCPLAVVTLLASFLTNGAAHKLLPQAMEVHFVCAGCFKIGGVVWDARYHCGSVQT